MLLAQAARFRGAHVELVHGPLQLPDAWLEGLTTHAVKSSEEMQSKLISLHLSVDAIAMAAAVADLRHRGLDQNIKPDKQTLLASLTQGWEPVPDLLAELVAKRPSGQKLLGFAALTGDDQTILQRAERKRLDKGCDLLMANPIDRDGEGFDAQVNGGWLIGEGGMVRRLPVVAKLALAHQLLDSLLELNPSVCFAPDQEYP